MTTKKQGLGETEKVLLVGALAFGGWMLIDVLVSRAEQPPATTDQQQTAVARRAEALRSRRRAS